MKNFFFLLAIFVSAISIVAQSDKPILMQSPAVSRTHIVFVYGDDLWTVTREGGEARRLTVGVGAESNPAFSPDGKLVAFTGEYDGNVDAFVVDAAGGVPRRLTWHPGQDRVVGWTNDGRRVLFHSGRNSYMQRFSRLFTIGLDGGGLPEELPLPMAEEGSYSADGARIAYVPLTRGFNTWKGYRGGMTTPVWIAKLSDSSIERVPRENSNDFNPMWVGNKVYFLSDRNGAATLFAYEPGSKRVSEVMPHAAAEIKSASAGPDAIVYEQFGSLHLFDLKSGRAQRVNVSLSGDVGAVRPRYEKVGNRIRYATLSPTGARALFEARGEILSVPAEKGDVRNLTRTPSAAERDPGWSPDGKSIAYFSDEAGEYALHIREQSGMGDVRKISLGDPPSYFYNVNWSPDSKKIAYTDKRLNVWYVDLDKGNPVKVDTNTYESPFRTHDPVWSPDSRWLAYTKQLRNHLRAVFVYSLEQGTPNQVTDGMSDARYACFDKNGKYLYFTASTDAGAASAWLDMSSFNRPVTRSVYMVVLRKDDLSPLAPESDEEKAEEKKTEDRSQKSEETQAAPAAKKDDPKKPVVVNIDLEGIGQRILALPIPARPYTGLVAGKTGIVFVLESLLTPVGVPGPPGPPPGRILHKFELEKRKFEKVADNIGSFNVSHNGEKMLYRTGERWFIASATQAFKAGEGALKTDDMEVYVNPPAEWKQMYREAVRIQRDFFYDPGHHGLNLTAVAKKYEPYLERMGSRSELNYLFAEMFDDMTVGHLYVGGGDRPQARRVRGGLLGADFKIENGRYRLARVYNGENWNPQLRAPLTQPGVNVVAGEYLLSVGGRDLRATDNIYSFFEATANKSVAIRVGTDPTGANSREVTVVPVESETTLRNLAWIEDNRRKVDQLSGGRVAYVYLPNTSVGGYTNFNRYYFAQVGKEGAVIDERFNGGGSVADYMIDQMRRPVMNYWVTREGEPWTTPLNAIFGPKAMIVNEWAGSGGDALPWYFRRTGLGPLIGKRTWGGLVGIYDYPQLIDGGFLTSPRMAFHNPEGEWEVENHGVAPDIAVEFDPQAVRAGRDPQLERAVQVVIEAMKKNPLPKYKRPPYPNYQKSASRLSAAGR